MFHSTKTWGHEEGLSCVFRQWRADSHCNLLHGYALKVRLEFACVTLDDRNWVMDFGGLKEIKEWLKSWFDHTTIIASDDPHLEIFEELADKGLISLRVLSHVGCEIFARHIGIYVQQWLNDKPCNKHSRNLWVHSCEVAEHGGNSAIWIQGQ